MNVESVVAEMSSWRERDAGKQVRSRRINEWTADEDLDGAGSVRCECRDPDCDSVLTLALGEYEGVRAHATRFIVAPNHDNPESERIVKEHDRFAVVEAVTGDEAKQARRSYGR